MAKIYLHIGMNKAGSTTLQNVLFANSKQLEKNGILYPTYPSPLMGKGQTCHREFSNFLGFTLKPKATPNSELIKTWQELLSNAINKSNAEAVIISSENFILRKDISVVKKIFEPWDVKIIVYLRRHDSWWKSAYGQAIKTVSHPPWRRSFNSYYEYQIQNHSQHLSYFSFLEAWAKNFGYENIIVIPFEKAQIQPSLEESFFNSIGMKEIGQNLKTGQTHSNPALNAVKLSLIDAVQRSRSIDQERKNAIINKVIQEEDFGGEEIKFPDGLKHFLITSNSHEYEMIAKKYLGRADGKLFYDPIPEVNPGECEDYVLVNPQFLEFFSRHFKV